MQIPDFLLVKINVPCALSTLVYSEHHVSGGYWNLSDHK